jgi:hypothetical protein
VSCGVKPIIPLGIEDIKKLWEIYAPALAYTAVLRMTDDEFLFIFQKYFGTAIE